MQRVGVGSRANSRMTQPGGGAKGRSGPEWERPTNETTSRATGLINRERVVGDCAHNCPAGIGPRFAPLLTWTRAPLLSHSPFPAHVCLLVPPASPKLPSPATVAPPTSPTRKTLLGDE